MRKIRYFWLWLNNYDNNKEGKYNNYGIRWANKISKKFPMSIRASDCEALPGVPYYDCSWLLLLFIRCKQTVFSFDENEKTAEKKYSNPSSIIHSIGVSQYIRAWNCLWPFFGHLLCGPKSTPFSSSVSLS